MGNNPSLFSQVEVTGTYLSDHDIIEITTSISYNNNLLDNSAEAQANENDLRTLNFHHENVSWERINKIIERMPWRKLFEVKKNMLNRIKMLKRKKNTTRDKNKLKSIENSIIETEKKISRTQKTRKEHNRAKS